MNDRLYRSRDDRILGGVCAGLAERLDLDPTLVRVGWVVLTILTGGVLFLLYIVMWVIVPEEPGEGVFAAPPMAPGAVPGWAPPSSTGWVAPSSWAAASGPTPGGPPPGWTPPATDATTGAGAAGAGPDPSMSGTMGAATPPPPTAAPAPGWSSPAGPSWAETRADRRAARRAARPEHRNDPLAGIVFGAILVLLGLYFLAVQYVPSLDLGRFWPVVIIVLGALLIARALYRPNSEG